MVARDSIAVALRARDGINFLLQTKGLDAKAVAQTLEHAAHTLTHHVGNTGRGDEDWSGDTAPPFAYGEVPTYLAWHNLRVYYRRISLVWILVVTPVGCSALGALQVLEHVTRICVAAARSPDVTPEKLTKKFPEVYLALAAVLAHSAIEPTRTLAEAELEAAALAGSDANKGLAAKAAATVAKGSKLTNILTAGHFSSSTGASKAKPGPSAADDSLAQSSVVGRKLADETEPLALGGFELPADAFAKVAVAEAQSPTKGGTVGLEGTGLEYLSGGANPPSTLGAPSPTNISSPSLAGTGLETLISPPAVSLDNPWGVTSSWGTAAGPLDPRLFGGLTPPAYAAPQGGGHAWAPSPTMSAPAPSTPAGAVPAPVQGEPPPAEQSPPKEKPLPPATPRDTKAIARGKGLLLVELWRASFIGAHLVRAGLQGEVVGTGKLSKSRASALYRLAAPPESANTVTASLRAAALDPALGERGAAPGSFVAHLGAVSKQQVVFLRYRLPAIACHPPVLLSLSVSTGLGWNHSEPGVMLLVQYAISPALTGPLRSATLDVDVPPALGNPASVAPHGEWSAQQRRLRWRLQALSPGNNSVLLASFSEPALPEEVAPQEGDGSVPSGTPKTPKTPGTSKSLTAPSWASALAKAGSEARAALCFVGPSEATLSGIRLSSGADSSRLTPLIGARCAFHGEVTARPLPTQSAA